MYSPIKYVVYSLRAVQVSKTFRENECKIMLYSRPFPVLLQSIRRIVPA